MKATTIFNGKSSNNKELKDHIFRLPLDCLMRVMTLTSPKDACRSAAVCTTFQSAADSDYVWKSFLPADLSSILHRAETDVQQLPVTKKKLYLHMCHNWILLDGGTKSLRLDLLSGTKTILLHKQHLSIKDSIDDLGPIVMKGTILCKDLSPSRNYAAYIIFKRTVGVQIVRITQLVYDSSSGHITLMYSMNIGLLVSQTREDGWREIKLGEFNTGVEENQTVRFIISDHQDAISLRKLIFRGIEVRHVC